MAGFPGFVVMTTKPPLPDQTEIRASTDRNVHIYKHEGEEEGERGRAERCRRKEKAGVRNGARRRRGTAWDGGRAKRRCVSLRKLPLRLPSPAPIVSYRPDRSATPRRLAVVCCTEHTGPVSLNQDGLRADISSASTPSPRRLSLLHPRQ